MKLYELTENYQKVLELMEGEENAQTLIDTLECIDAEIDSKADSIAKVSRYVNSDITALDDEIKRLQSRKKALENNDKNLKEYLKTQMEKINKDKIKGTLFTISIQKNPPSMVITDKEKIPAKFIDVIPSTTAVNTTALKAALKNGEEIEGAELTQGTSLRIR